MATGKISLILGSHAHVPYGSDTGEFENAYTNLLRPFISSLYKYPQIPAALHYSGVLLYWIERSHPELFMLIEDMVSRKQVEMLGGGFYEPMLPIIPLQDKIGQIELLTTYLRKQFGKRPQGCWIPAFAWEQNLVSPLAACGMGFTFLSERQFALGGGALADGVPSDGDNSRVLAPCICEDQGKLITVFPVLQSMETALADTGIASLLPAAQESYRDTVVSIFPRKIAMRRNESIENAWNRFFEDLSQCENLVEMVSPGKLFKNLSGLEKRYFPDSAEGGILSDGESPRIFAIVHPEAGGIYAKMIFTNVLINQLRGDKSRKLSAHEELWKAQGCALFSATGVQGLHNHALRNAAYSALLGAERITRERGKFAPSLVPFDFNMDGEQEWIFQDARINCYVQSLGGGIFELDYLPKTWNYLATCGGRVAFADRLLPAGASIEKLEYGTLARARICCNEHYELVELDKVRRKLHLVLRQSVQGTAFPQGTASPVGSASPMGTVFGNVEIAKTYTLKKDMVCVGYALVNRGTAKESFQFAPEIDLALPGEGDAFTRFFVCKPVQTDKSASADTPLAPGSNLLQDGVPADGLKIHDIKNEVQIILSANRPFDGKISPVRSPHDGAGGKLFQAFCIMPLLPVSLEPGEKWEIEFALKFSH